MSDLYGNQSDGSWTWNYSGWEPYTFGTRFQVTTAGELTRAGYYRGAAADASWASLHLYGASGALLWQSLAPTDSGAVGWQWTAISPPVAVTTGVTYTIAGYLSGTRGVARNDTPASRASPPAPFVFDATSLWYANGGPAHPTTALGTLYMGLSVTWEEAAEPEPPGPTISVRTTALEVYVHNGVEWQFDGGAYAATCSFGFDQRVAEATVRRTGGGEADVQYWSPIEIKMGCTPGEGVATRFKGYVVPIDNALFPIDNVLTCRGHLYRAQWVRQTTPGGKVMAPPDVGESDEVQVRTVLTDCGVPLPVPATIGGTGKDLGSGFLDFDNPTVPGPFTWAEGQAGLDYIDALDAVSVPDDSSGRYRTFETLAGDIFRTKMATAPESSPDFTFTEGVDVLEARITRDPGGAANRVTVTGAPTALPGGVVGVEDLDVYRFTAAAPEGEAPYLPPGLPDGPDGYPQVTTSFSSPLIEKGLITDPDVAADVISCEAVAEYLLGEHNCVLDTLEFSTPRDDLLGPGQTIHLTAPRLGITDEDQHYWLQHLEVTVDERGVFTQRLVCLRRS